ncbi:MAG: NifU family protein [Bacilli bacterium]|nr:NifU family protein [Bacilli bacterium]
MEEKVKEVLDDLRPFLMNDGGNVELIKIEDNIVYIAFQGACAGCALRDMTLTEGIEKTIKEKVPEIKEVRLVN